MEGRRGGVEEGLGGSAIVPHACESPCLPPVPKICTSAALDEEGYRRCWRGVERLQYGRLEAKGLSKLLHPKFACNQDVEK